MEAEILKEEMGVQEAARAVQINPHGIFLSLGGRWFLMALPMRMAIKEPKRKQDFVFCQLSLWSQKHQLLPGEY